MGLRSLDHLGNPMDMRGEGCHDDPSFSLRENLLERVAYYPLGGDVTGSFAVGRITEIGENSFLTERGETPEVHRGAFYGREVYLVVAGEDDQTRVRADGYSDGSRNGVVDLDELKAEASELGLATGLYLVEFGVLYAELLELALHEPQRHSGAVDGDVEFAEHVRYRADVVLVSVGKYYSSYLVGVLP